MLESLRVKNYVLIDNLELEFNDGFSVLTGETGSGKSIILGALSLLTGEKGDKDAIRAGEEYAQISGVFSSLSEEVLSFCEERGIVVEDDKISINRVIKANGRSSYSVNGTPITRVDGKMLGEQLLDIASQHENQSLLRNDSLIEIVDEASASKEKLRLYKEAYREYLEKEKELSELIESCSKAEEEKEYISFCLKELDKANLKEGEEDELKGKSELMASSEFLREALYNINEYLKSASSSISESLAILDKAVRKDESLSSFSKRLESGSIEIDDIHDSLREYLSRINFSESDAEEINSRLSEIQKIKRRFGGSVERAIEIRDDYRKKLEDAENKDQLIEELTAAVAKAKDRAMSLALVLSDKRAKGAKLLSSEVEKNLHTLGMESSKFRVDIKRVDRLKESGCDDISFRLIANKGEKESDISASASGGELSRILLALKVSIESEKKDSRTLFFDEIDSGLGGAVANSVAEKLYALSKNHQVLSITHLPQIAAKADTHYVVSKQEVKGRTVSSINEVRDSERIREIARLLSGDESDISLKHAEKLLSEV